MSCDWADDQEESLASLRDLRQVDPTHSLDRPLATTSRSSSMGAAQGSALRLVDAEIELRRETKDFARCTLRLLVVSCYC